MYFRKNGKKIKRILKEENIVVSSKSNPQDKEILKFVTYELSNGERYNTVIDNNLIESLSDAKKFLSKINSIESAIECRDFTQDLKDLTSDIKFEYVRGNSQAPISVCGKYAYNALRYEQDYYKAVEYIDYCFATGKNIDYLTNDEKSCYVISHIEGIGQKIDNNTEMAMTITSSLMSGTGSNPDGYLPSKAFTRKDYLNGTAASLKLTTAIMKQDKNYQNLDFIEAVYGKDAADILRQEN